MPFEWDAPNIGPGTNGPIEIAIRGLEPIDFSDIFGGIPQLYAGSSFTVEEVIEFGCLIKTPELIDVDFRWYPPKKYLGTWTIFDQVSAFGTSPEDRGFIEDTICKIRRYSVYVIQGNANVPIAVHEQSSIDNCNFYLGEVGLNLPPINVSVQPLIFNEAVLKSRHTLQRVPLVDRNFIAKIKTIGFHIDPGAELTFVNYKCRVINAISVDLPPFPITVCDVAPQSCNGLFANFLQDFNAGSPQSLAYASEALATEAANNSGGISANNYVESGGAFTCTIAPFTVYPYWLNVKLEN